MSDFDIQTPAFDPFADANAENSGSKDHVHVRVQQRNGRKSLTTVQGLNKEFSYNKILKDLKKEFCCNGTVVQDPELGQVIQLQGDRRKNVSSFLIQILEMNPEEEAEEDGANIDLNSQRKGKCVVLKTSTCQNQTDVTDVCMDESVVSSDPVIAFLLDEKRFLVKHCEVSASSSRLRIYAKERLSSLSRY